MLIFEILSYKGIFMEQEKKIGLTEYLYDDSINIDEIIIKSHLDNKTSVILSGAIPPNPSELIMSKRLESLIQNLKKILISLLLILLRFY